MRGRGSLQIRYFKPSGVKHVGQVPILLVFATYWQGIITSGLCDVRLPDSISQGSHGGWGPAPASFGIAEGVRGDSLLCQGSAGLISGRLLSVLRNLSMGKLFEVPRTRHRWRAGPLLLAEIAGLVGQTLEEPTAHDVRTNAGYLRGGYRWNVVGLRSILGNYLLAVP
jgi:hypothetical protein